jgi:hypothetical protein
VRRSAGLKTTSGAERRQGETTTMWRRCAPPSKTGLLGSLVPGLLGSRYHTQMCVVPAWALPVPVSDSYASLRRALIAKFSPAGAGLELRQSKPAAHLLPIRRAPKWPFCDAKRSPGCDALRACGVTPRPHPFSFLFRSAGVARGGRRRGEKTTTRADPAGWLRLLPGTRAWASVCERGNKKPWAEPWRGARPRPRF